MKKQLVIFFLCFFSIQFVIGQECKDKITNYYESLDTTVRPVYLVVDQMPELFESTYFMKLLYDNEILKGLNCCPVKVWFSFVVEQDGSITNIEICPRMVDCDERLQQKETIIFKERLENLLKQTKTTSGILNGEKVAVACISNIHFECIK